MNYSGALRRNVALLEEAVQGSPKMKIHALFYIGSPTKASMAQQYVSRHLWTASCILFVALVPFRGSLHATVVVVQLIFTHQPKCVQCPELTIYYCSAHVSSISAPSGVHKGDVVQLVSIFSIS